MLITPRIAMKIAPNEKLLSLKEKKTLNKIEIYGQLESFKQNYFEKVLYKANKFTLITTIEYDITILFCVLPTSYFIHLYKFHAKTMKNERLVSFGYQECQGIYGKLLGLSLDEGDMFAIEIILNGLQLTDLKLTLNFFNIVPF